MLRFEEVGDEVLEAAITATTEVAAEAADEARGSVLDLPPHFAAGFPWYGFTPRTESEVTSTSATRSSSGEVTAQFGATARRGGYALMLERMQPYLRPAFDKTAPRLAARIAKLLEEAD